ncbi:MAG: 3'(2'),5'-bisphosphate nucleotidase CysQ [Bacteroidia bacterium]
MNPAFLETAVKAALAAGNEILSVYNNDAEVELKSDNSPLTIADKLAHKKIVEVLAETLLPVLSEEGKNILYQERKNWNQFWLVDPLDGTKEFIKRNGEFTVNIALIENENPVMGVVYAPVLNILYYAAENLGSYKCSIDEKFLSKLFTSEFFETLTQHSQKLPIENYKNEFTVVASRSHLTSETQSFINDLKLKHGDIKFISSGSSLKICLVAEGTADVYPRLAPTMEWDTAAGHAIAVYSGKSVNCYKNNESIKYNKENLLNEWFVVS